MSFKICIALQVKSGNLEENEALIKKALETEPDFIELRLDYIDDVRKLTERFMSELLSLIPPKIPVIATFRAYSEGGQMAIDKNLRLKHLINIIKAQPRFLDIELNTEKLILKQVIRHSKEEGTQLIFSYHDFKKTPSLKECINLLKISMERLINDYSIDPNFLHDSIFKIILTAQSFEDNLVPLRLCEKFQKEGKQLISFCMGAHGMFSRVTCVKAGSFLTFGSLEEGIGTAPGQLTINKIREMHQLLFKD